MNPYNFSLLIFAFCTFLISVLVWLKRRDETGQRYFVFCIFVTIWGVGEAIQFSQSSSYEVSLLSGRICNMAAVFIPVTWLHFISVYSNRTHHNRKLLIFLYCISGVIVLFGFTPWFIPRVEPALSFNYFVRLGPIYHIFTFIFFTIVPFGFFQLVKMLKKSAGEESIQIKGLINATAAGFIGGSLTFFPAYEIMVPQYGLFLMPIHPFVMAYFMIRHKLLDFEQIAESFQREKLATIGLIAASINHEIRNPLYAVKGLLETYIDYEQEGLPHKTPLETSKRALTQVQRALDVITKLNRFAKPISTNSKEQNSTASLQEAIEAVLDLVAYEFELDRIHIDNRIDALIPKVAADQRQVEEIFFNLIVNACHAMPKGGRLEISAREVDNKVKINISDTGAGIPNDRLERIFEPFYTTKGEQGTGLGLYITKQLVERNGGRIVVKSQANAGTSFTMEFPIA